MTIKAFTALRWGPALRWGAALCFGVAVAAQAGPAHAGDIRIIAGDLPPYSFDNNGKPDGVVTAITAALAREVGVPFTPEFLPWVRAQDEAKAHAGIGIIPLTRSPEREAAYKWVGPLFLSREVLMVLDGGKKAPVKSLAEAVDLSVCVLLGTPGEATLRKAGIKTINAVAKSSVCAHMLDSDHVDAWSVGELRGAFEYKREGLDPARLVAGAEVGVNAIYLGFAHDTPDDIIAPWQKAFETLRDRGDLAAIEKSFR